MQLIGYRRVSTQGQQKSGLGLEAQTESISTYARQTGAVVVAWYVETESGKRHENRPELAKALAHAKRNGAILCVAKLDRLSRNLAFLSALMESKVQFVCVDNPHATPLTLHVLAAVAEQELRAISLRTKDALTSYRARGGKCGSHRPGHWDGREESRLKGLEKGRQESIKSRQDAVRTAYTDLIPMMVELRSQGLSFKAIAGRMNELGHMAGANRPWCASNVFRVLKRAS